MWNAASRMKAGGQEKEMEAGGPGFPSLMDWSI